MLGQVEIRVERRDLHLRVATLAVIVVEKRAALLVVDDVVALIMGIVSDVELALRQAGADRGEERGQQGDLVDADLEIEDLVDVVGAAECGVEEERVGALATDQDVIAKLTVDLVVALPAINRVVAVSAGERVVAIAAAQSSCCQHRRR